MRKKIITVLTALSLMSGILNPAIVYATEYTEGDSPAGFEVSAEVGGSYKVSLPAEVTLINYDLSSDLGMPHQLMINGSIIEIENCNLPANKILTLDIGNDYKSLAELADEKGINAPAAALDTYCISDFLVGESDPNNKLSCDIHLETCRNGEVGEYEGILYDPADIGNEHSCFLGGEGYLPKRIGSYAKKCEVQENDNSSYFDDDGNYHDSGAFSFSLTLPELSESIMYCGKPKAGSHMYDIKTDYAGKNYWGTKNEALNDSWMTDSVQYQLAVAVVTDENEFEKYEPASEDDYHHRNQMKGANIPSDTYVGTLQFVWGIEDNPDYLADHPVGP